MNDLAKVDFSNGPMIYLGDELGYSKSLLIGRENPCVRLSWTRRRKAISCRSY